MHREPTKRCPVRGCKAKHPRRLLMCRHHWLLVPQYLRRQVWAHFRPEQLEGQDPSRAYLAAATAAIAAAGRAETAPTRQGGHYAAALGAAG